MGFGKILVQCLREYGKLGKPVRELVGESFCLAERLAFGVGKSLGIAQRIAFGQPIGIAQLVRLTQPIRESFNIGQRFAQSLGKPFRVAESFSVSERIAVRVAQRLSFGIGQPLSIGERFALSESFGIRQCIPVGQRLSFGVGKPFAVGQRVAKSVGNAAAQRFRLRLAAATQQRLKLTIEQPVQRIVERQPQPIDQHRKSSLVIINRLGFIQCRVGIIRRIAIEFRPAVLHTGRSGHHGLHVLLLHRRQPCGLAHHPEPDEDAIRPRLPVDLERHGQPAGLGGTRPDHPADALLLLPQTIRRQCVHRRAFPLETLQLLQPVWRYVHGVGDLGELPECHCGRDNRLRTLKT